jgi:hypothetical protein
MKLLSIEEIKEIGDDLRKKIENGESCDINLALKLSQQLYFYYWTLNMSRSLLRQHIELDNKCTCKSKQKIEWKEK